MDEHVAKSVTEGLRRRGVDVVTVQELGLQAAEDQQHLQRAAQEDRVVVTQDTDFLRLHAAGVSHGGIVYAPQQAPVPQMPCLWARASASSCSSHSVRGVEVAVESPVANT